MSNEPSPRPWRVNSVTGGHISDANGDPVCFCVGSGCGDRAALIVDAVNERAKFEEARMKFPDFRPVIIAAGQRDAAIAERDQLRDELADKTRNYEDVIAYHKRTEEHLHDLVKRLAEFVNDTACFTPSDKEGAQSILREARAAIGEDRP